MIMLNFFRYKDDELLRLSKYLKYLAENVEDYTIMSHNSWEKVKDKHSKGIVKNNKQPDKPDKAGGAGEN